MKEESRKPGDVKEREERVASSEKRLPFYTLLLSAYLDCRRATNVRAVLIM